MPFWNTCSYLVFRKVCVSRWKIGNREVRIGLCVRLIAEWPTLSVDKHDSVCDCLLQPFTHTITLFIQLTDNEQAGLGLFTLCICFVLGRIRVSLCLHRRRAPCMCSSSVYKQQWSAVTVALFAQGLMPSVWMCLANQAFILFSQREDRKWWKTQRDNWSSHLAISEKDGEGKIDLKRNKETWDLLSRLYWVISKQELFTKYHGVLFC